MDRVRRLPTAARALGRGRSAWQKNRHCLDKLAGVCYCFSEMSGEALRASQWAPKAALAIRAQ